ncbi:site-specific DNA-methyltransferase [Patescibacteria group bacterium]|nr:site-specific DNA-methyltransferase [Candidatus Falkowbacteria bacterium]MBU3905888.1 site-specific DNA-methyltransferase [Patescibacteria group bacterium]MCG2698568.1 site-specific DNA-methyltransferase [Candidatus Parcubacteria bacterium]MBU4015418.1 site-specific DNA-methyltransferase [Patescibacteria group bacterium]MBU4026679.1 site-specific DNA-methyltransferase [Patescibacteria group bacterium]
MKNKQKINKIILGDSLEILKNIENSSIDVVLTDPPYFLDKLDNNWQYDNVNNKKNQQVIKSLPSGMKFDREQGKKFYNWYFKISKEILRVLKPGGFFFSFSSPRLYHRMASAVDDAGMEIRDCFLWLYTQNQAKAMSLNHFIDKLNINNEKKEKLKSKFQGWKTPQLKSCFEPIVMAQKPTDGTFLNNMIKNSIGLLNTEVKVGDNMFPANILTVENINEIIDKAFLIKKPSKEEKSDFNSHKTVKPLELCEHLIKLTAFYKDAVVLDPFVGSGTTALAAKKLGLHYIGVDINPEYVDIALKRLNSMPKLKLSKMQNKKREAISFNAQVNIFDLMYSKGVF